MTTREYTNLFSKGDTIRALRDGSLIRDFGAPPCSVLDGRARWWLARKKGWLSLGLKKVQGRKDDLIWSKQATDTMARMMNKKLEFERTSWYDPVLCEVMYRWFCPKDGLVVDPFSGGWVRGIVASCLGLRYVGIDLRPEQVEANREDAARVCKSNEHMPIWIAGDSVNIVEHVRKALNLKNKDTSAVGDFVQTSPPYPGVERYSEDKRDLNTMDYLGPKGFREKYIKIIAGTVELMKPNRFACFHVGDVRDPDTGLMYEFPHDTVTAFTDAGAPHYNTITTVDPFASSLVRMRKIFEGGRKVMRTHQIMLNFIKGDPKIASDAVQGDTPRRANEHLKKRQQQGKANANPRPRLRRTDK
jgi:DNA modification methylase